MHVTGFSGFPYETRFGWDAVRIAKDINIEDLPDQMNQNGVPIANENLAEDFAAMFEKKIVDTVKSKF